MFDISLEFSREIDTILKLFSFIVLSNINCVSLLLFFTYMTHIKEYK